MLSQADTGQQLSTANTGDENTAKVGMYLLHRMGVEATCRVKYDPSGLRNVQRNTRRALVLFFFLAFALVVPMRFSTSAFLNFKMPTQSMLQNSKGLVSTKCLSNNNAQKNTMMQNK